MKNDKDKQGQAPANSCDRIMQMLRGAAFPQTVSIETGGLMPKRYAATGISKRELYATFAMASLAHAVTASQPASGGTRRSGWARRVAADAVELARSLDEALDETEPTKDNE